MRRLEVVGKSFTFTDDIDPQYKSLSFQVQVLRGQYNFVRAEFFLEGQELANFLAGDRDYEKLAEEKMRWILELNQTPVDAYLLETMQREQREILDSVEDTKAAAIEAARAEAEAKIAEKDLEISALQQMIVELTLMLSMIGQPELPTEPDPEPPIEEEPEPPVEDPLPPEDPEPPIEEPPTETPEKPPVEDPPQEDPDIPPEEGAPDDPELETPADPVADDPDTTPIDEGGQGGE